MICNRCGSHCPQRDEGYCLHCLIGTGMEKALGKSLKETGIDEGFPDWQKPTKTDLRKQGEFNLGH